ncbi:hypothetical protein B0G77_5892 [Paraburkholderia sp. BL10I2N1]|nr:hypothetical protein B0G77_5892 [Paraburkholderia sp. BL10I2N1]
MSATGRKYEFVDRGSLPSSTGRAFNIIDSDGMPPMSKICDQRKLNQALRITRHRARRELPGDGFHAESPAARDDNGRLRVVDFFQSAGNIPYDSLKELRHMVDGSVGVND